MTLRQTRVIFRLLFLLPVVVLGVGLFGLGVVRIAAEWTGSAGEGESISGLATLAISVIPLVPSLLLTWLFARRPQRQPPPAQASVAPRASSQKRATSPSLDPTLLMRQAEALGLEAGRSSASSGLRILRRDHWHPGYLVAAALLMLTVCVLPPSIAAGSLEITPLNTALVAFGTWISLFLILIALPVSTRSIDFIPAEDTLVIQDGRRRRIFGLSRIQALEVKLQSESTRDSEIQQPRSTRWHPQLIAWIEADGRGLTPFELITGPRSGDRSRAERHAAEMAALAEPIARVLSISIGRPEGVQSEQLAYE